jgi:hypothetical protein
MVQVKAEVTFSLRPNLDISERITFLYNPAWPQLPGGELFSQGEEYLVLLHFRTPVETQSIHYFRNSGHVLYLTAYLKNTPGFFKVSAGLIDDPGKFFGETGHITAGSLLDKLARTSRELSSAR